MSNLGWMANWYGVTGTASSSTFLRGDGAWSTVTGSTGGGTSVSSGANIEVSGGSTVALSTAVAITRLTVTGGSTLGTLSAGNSTLGAVNQGNSTAANLSVSGGSTVGTLHAGASTHTSLSVSGGSTIGTLSAGASTVATLAVTGVAMLSQGAGHRVLARDGVAVYFGDIDANGRGLIFRANGSDVFTASAGGQSTIAGTLSVGRVINASTSGLHITSGTPAVSTMTLYNNAGILTWNGSALGSSGGTISGSSGAIAKFTSSSDVGDSIITQQGSTGVTVAGSAVVRDGLRVSSGTLTASSGAVIGRTIYVPAGLNTLSAAVSSMANGACLMLDASTYTQSVRVKIPSTVTRFSILGKGAAVTKISYTADVAALTSTLSGNNAHRIVHANLEGFQCRYSAATSCTQDGITLWGTGTVNASVNGSVPDRGAVIQDVSLVYDDNAGTPSQAWKTNIRLLDMRMAYLDKITIRRWSNETVGTGIRLESCLNSHLSNFYIMCVSTGIDLVRASSAFVSEHTLGSGVHHGCEDISISAGTVQISNVGINLGYKAFTCKIHDMEIVTPTLYGINEEVSSGTENGGYHHIHDIYFDVASSGGTMVHLARPGSRVNGCSFQLFAAANGVVCDSTAVLCDVSNNTFRNSGSSGKSGVYFVTGYNKATGNVFENSAGSGADILVGSTATGCLVAHNMIDYVFSDLSGAGASTGGNPVH